LSQAAQPVFGDSAITRKEVFRRLKQLVPWVLMVGVIALLARLVDVRATVTALSNLTPMAILLATILFVLDRFSMSFKWNILLRSRGYSLSHWQAFRLYLASGFVGYAIPATIGSDIFRAARLALAGQSASGVSATIILERVLGLLAILTLSSVGLLCSVLEGRTDLIPVAGAVFAALLLGSVLTGISMSDRVYRFLGQLTLGIRRNRVIKVLHSLHDEYVALSKGVRPLAWFFVLSIVNQLIRTLMCVPLLVSLGIDVNLLALFALLPLSKAFIQFTPVPAGIGVAEGATVAALTLAHVSAPQALVVALVLRAVELATLGPAGLAYVIDAWYLRKTA
jgi:uncharacterized protein (TIRG00374 family)